MDFDPGIITAGLTRVQPKSPQELFGEQLRMRAMQQAIESNDALEQERRQTLAQHQQQQANAQQYGQALQQGFKVGADGEPDLDWDLVLQHAPPEMAPTVIDLRAKAQKSKMERRELLGKLAEQDANAFGYDAMEIEARGHNPALASIANQKNLAAGRLSKAEADANEQLIAQGPEGVQQVVAGWKAKSPKAQDIANVAAGRAETGRHNLATEAQTVATNSRQAATQAETARHNQAMERIQSLGVGRAEASQAETARHNRAMEESARTTKTARPIIAGDAEDLANFDTSLDDLTVLRSAIAEKGETGTAAALGAWVPKYVTDLTGIGTEAKQKQALIDRVKQVIGKTLEGGVLRKEDELKYEKILPTIGDTTAVVKTKLDGLESAIKQRKERRLETLADAGFNTDRFQQRQADVGRRAKAKAVLVGAGKISDDAAIETFLKNNPDFK